MASYLARMSWQRLPLRSGPSRLGQPQQRLARRSNHSKPDSPSQAAETKVPTAPLEPSPPTGLTARLPRVFQTWVWLNVLPKPIRNRFLRRPDQLAEAVVEKKRAGTAKPSLLRRIWENPASPLIFLPLLAGSQAIQVMIVRSDLSDFTRSVNSRLEVLKEILGRIHSGEWVVVDNEGGLRQATAPTDGRGILSRKEAEREIKRLLGTDNDEEELEWLGIMNDIKRVTFSDDHPAEEPTAEASESAEEPETTSTAKETNNRPKKVAFY